MKELINAIKAFQKHMEGCADRAYDKGEPIPVKFTVDNKEIDFILNADMFDNLNKLLNDEIEYAEYYKKDFGN